MPAVHPKEPTSPSAPAGPHKPHIYTLEATGLIVIALLLLALTLIRYWHNISWSAR